MAKATASAVDFLNVIAGGTEDYEVSPGTFVVLRTLSFTEVQKLSTAHRDDATEMAFQALALGLASPELSAEQLEEMRNGKPGPLMKMAQRIMQISGMLGDEDGVPLAGGASLS